jgi:hypothetical protein
LVNSSQGRAQTFSFQSGGLSAIVAANLQNTRMKRLIVVSKAAPRDHSLADAGDPVQRAFPATPLLPAGFPFPSLADPWGA